MSPEAQRVAIAGACGIQPVRRWRVWYDKDRQHGAIEIHSKAEALISAERAKEDFIRWGDEANYTVSEPEEYDSWTYAPDYLNSLDCMHEAEKTLDAVTHNRFREELWTVTTGGENDGYEEVTDDLRRAFVSATAAQRAEAFLKAKGLWK